MPWNQNSQSAKRQPQGSNRKHLYFILIALIAIIGIAFAILMRAGLHTSNEEPIKPRKQTGQIQTVTPQPNLPPPLSTETKSHVDRRQQEIERLRAMTPDEKLAFLYERAKGRSYNATPAKGRAFGSGVEQVMSWIFTTRLGDTPPPLPKMSILDKVHLAEIILSDNPASKDDSEEVKNAKEIVALAKKELIKYIKEGGDVEGFLTYYRDQLSEAHHAYNSARRMVFEAYRTETDREVCDVYLQRINAELEEKGIKRVIVPDQLIERFTKEMSKKGTEQ